MKLSVKNFNKLVSKIDRYFTYDKKYIKEKGIWFIKFGHP